MVTTRSGMTTRSTKPTVMGKRTNRDLNYQDFEDGEYLTLSLFFDITLDPDHISRFDDLQSLFTCDRTSIQRKDDK